MNRLRRLQDEEAAQSGGDAVTPSDTDDEQESDQENSGPVNPFDLLQDSAS